MDLGYQLVKTKDEDFWHRKDGGYGAVPMGPDDSDDGEDDEKPIATKTDYPSFYCEGAPKELYDVPEEGTAVVKYRVTSRTENERNGEKSYSVTIDIESFEPQVKRNGSGPLSKTKGRLDRYMEKR